MSPLLKKTILIVIGLAIGIFSRMVHRQVSTRQYLFVVYLASFLFVVVGCYAGENRTLAQVCEAYGVSKETNTMLHASEHDAKSSHGRIFSMFRSNPNQALMMDDLWTALAHTKFVAILTKEPQSPNVLIILNTGMSSKMLPRAAIWVDANGFLNFLPDREKRPREFMMFSGPEVVAWANDNMMKYGR